MAAVDEIKSRLDVLDVVSQYTNLQSSGRSYKAICPFHTEKTASFFVFPERQSWRCFGACATGGDIFSFLMRIENLDFTEALKRLAQQAGVTLAEKGGRKGGEDVLYRINEAALGFFGDLLASVKIGSGARAYLRDRGLTPETTDKFQIGLSPGGGKSLKDHLTSKGFTEEQMALAGVVTESRGGGYRDMFRGRLMFPIRDGDGRLAGFGARSLDDSTPKYLNSPRTPVFDKGHILYAMHLAKDAARERGIVIVEGYMDAIMAHQHGFSNVVASMGTAITPEQVALVRGTVSRPGSSTPMQVVLALDPDVAGQEATLRSMESSWGVFETRPVGRTQAATIYQRIETPSLTVARLPQGKDPDKIILESPEEWANLIDNAVPLMDYLFTALSSRVDLSTPQGKARLAELLFPLVTATPDPIQQDFYFQRLANLLGVTEETLRASLGRPRPGRASYRDRTPGPQRGRGSQPGGVQPAATAPFARLDHDPLEEYCLAVILHNTQLSKTREQPPVGQSREGEPQAGSSEEGWKAPDGLRLEQFRRIENREVFTNWMKCSTLEALREGLDEDLKGHLEYLLDKTLPTSERKQLDTALEDCVRRLEERYLRELKSEEELRLSQATLEEFEQQGEEILQLNERLKHIFGV